MRNRDGITTTQDPVIYTLQENLVLACGGSYHTAKFLPIIGRFVVDEVNGVLAAPMKAKWAKVRRGPSGLDKQPYLVPTRDLREL